LQYGADRVIAAEVTAGATSSVEWVTLIVGFAGGLALFLYGMDELTESLRIVVGDRARRILGRLTASRLAGLATGAGVTAVVQSSSVTTVLLVGFVSAGLMSFAQTIPVILGSNVGTTITAQIIAFNVTAWALGFVAIGFATGVLSKRPSRRAIGLATVGLGLIFLGMDLMGDAMEPLRTYDPFIDAMEQLDNVFVAILVGAAFTALVQSSSATTGVVIVLAGQGLITLEAGVALVLGANIGTTVTAMLAAIGKERTAQRVAVAHLLFNVIGVLLWLPLIDALVSWTSSIGGGLQREIANAHTAFNVINALVFLPFVSRFARVVERLAVDKPAEPAVAPRYLEDALIGTPPLALARARMEMLRMATRVQGMLISIIPAILDRDVDELDRIEAMDDEIDELHGVIIEYLGKVSEEKLTSASRDELVDQLEATNALEAMGDIIETNLVTLGRQAIALTVATSRQTREMLEGYHRSVLRAFELAMVALSQEEDSAARQVTKMKGDVNEEEERLRDHLSIRLVGEEPNRVATYRLETDVVANLKRLFYFTRRIARVAVPVREQAALSGE
jgi:phosphate:Na+ symporter